MCIMVYQQVSIFKRLFEGNPILREIHLTSSNNWGALPKTFVGSWLEDYTVVPLNILGIKSIYNGNP